MKNKYNIVGDLAYIELTYKNNTMFAIIDRDCLEDILSFKNTWKPDVKNGKVEAVTNRLQIKKVRTRYKMHNIVMGNLFGFGNNMVVDHINGNPLDNRRSNLRICSKKENAQNIHLTKSKTKVRNVTIEKGRYRVRINGYSYGSYKTLEEATAVANEKRKLHFNLPT